MSVSLAQAAPDPGSDPASGRIKLEARGVTVRFSTDRGPLTVLDNVDLQVREGEFVALVGPSGCGKSTFLNIVGGFLQPTSGEILVDGKPAREPDPRRIFVFQERGVFPWLTVAGNIAFGLAGLGAAERQQRVDHYVKLVGLSGFEHAYPHELSGGMKQRVEVARALSVSPEVLYLDEPFGALDSITRLTMRGELLRLWEADRKTVILVTHDIDESVQLADRILVMSTRPGRILREVTVDIPHPRDISSARYLEIRDQIAGELGLAHKV